MTNTLDYLIVFLLLVESKKYDTSRLYIIAMSSRISHTFFHNDRRKPPWNGAIFSTTPPFVFPQPRQPCRPLQGAALVEPKRWAPPSRPSCVATPLPRYVWYRHYPSQHDAAAHSEGQRCFVPCCPLVARNTFAHDANFGGRQNSPPASRGALRRRTYMHVDHQHQL